VRFLVQIQNVLREGNFEEIIETLNEKPRILVAALGVIARRQTGEVCSLMWEKDHPLMVLIEIWSSGVLGLGPENSLRTSEEIEFLSTLPKRYLSLQALVWGVGFVHIANTIVLKDEA